MYLTHEDYVGINLSPFTYRQLLVSGAVAWRYAYPAVDTISVKHLPDWVIAT